MILALIQLMIAMQNITSTIDSLSNTLAVHSRFRTYIVSKHMSSY